MCRMTDLSCVEDVHGCYRSHSGSSRSLDPARTLVLISESSGTDSTIKNGRRGIDETPERSFVWSCPVSLRYEKSFACFEHGDGSPSPRGVSHSYPCPEGRLTDKLLDTPRPGERTASLEISVRTAFRQVEHTGEHT